MDHQPVLISTIAIGLSVAFIGGWLARRAGLPPIIGYLLAGVVIGPFTPGLDADLDLAAQLAEIGIILLMFGVGIHFSLRDLLAVRSIAVPGAIGQIAIATVLGIGLGLALGWGIGGSLVLGLALSVASTVVLLRALEERHELDSPQGRIAVGWLIVEDLFTVVVLVLLPAVAPVLSGAASGDSAAGAVVEGLAVALAKALVFAVVIVVVGARVVPWLLVAVARDGSRELFTLAVLAIALGIAFTSSAVFGVSLALGAFLAGVVVGESDVSHQAATDALPLRDAFAVLFFVSVGMLVDPTFLLSHPVEIAAVVALIVVAKALAAFAIVVALGHPVRIALTVAAALAQIGEFSFILATLGMTLGLLPAEGFQLIVAGALLSITVNPALFRMVEPLDRRLRASPRMRALIERRGVQLRRLPVAEGTARPRGHTIVVGYGRVARLIAPALQRRGLRFVVISTDRRDVEALRARGIQAIYGDASHRDVLAEAGAATAHLLIVAVNDAHTTDLIVDRARDLDPTLRIVARSATDAQAAAFRSAEPTVEAVYGERELAIQMLRYALRRHGLSASEVELIAQGMRRRGTPAHATASAGPGPRPGVRERLRRLRRMGRDRSGARPSATQRDASVARLATDDAP